MKNKLWRWALDRMLEPVFEDDFATRIGRNPEDYDEIAFRMLRGLLGLKKVPPHYSDVMGRPIDPDTLFSAIEPDLSPEQAARNSRSYGSPSAGMT